MDRLAFFLVLALLAGAIVSNSQPTNTTQPGTNAPHNATATNATSPGATNATATNATSTPPPPSTNATNATTTTTTPPPPSSTNATNATGGDLASILKSTEPVLSNLTTSYHLFLLADALNATNMWLEQASSTPALRTIVDQRWGPPYTDPLQGLSNLLRHLNEFPVAQRKVLRTKGGSYLNHVTFFSLLRAPREGNRPAENSEINRQIVQQYGTFDKFKERFSTVCNKMFGSGYCWLIVPGSKSTVANTLTSRFANNADNNKQLKMGLTKNEDSPVMNGDRVVMALDLFEHAFLMDYPTSRREYIEKMWSIYNWDEINERFKEATTNQTSSSSPPN